jgi:NAD(P)-dependent dehydrogenase (short-subunit alcohol dehydrogenase family)
MSEFGLDGTLALITGGASGIGRACVQWMSEHGCAVVIADRDAQAAAMTAQAFAGVACSVDVRDADAVAAMVADVESRVGPIGILVNAAGVLQNPLPPGQLTMKEWDLVTGVDLRGTYAVCAAVGPRMAARERGSIVNIGSVAGLGACALHAYGPAKAAVIALTEGLAAEWGRKGVRVNTVSPGFTRTPAVDRSLAQGILVEERLADATALGRLIEPSEIAAAVGFLASPLASAITGVNITVDAGFLVGGTSRVYGEEQWRR